MWNLIDTHDTPRALFECGENKEKLKLLAAFQLLLPGMPFLYYGDEVGMTGGPDPDCRRGMLWDPQKQDLDMLRHYQMLINVRKLYPCLTEGDPCHQYADDTLGLVFIRRKGLLLVFHGRDGNVTISDHHGAVDILAGDTFAGAIGPYQVLVLKIK
jgi:glycosidase